MTNSTAHNDLLEKQLQWRYATKRFDATKKISPRDWQSLEQSLLAAPSSFGLQPWRFITISDTELRKKLLPHSWNQPQIIEASHLVVLAARTSVSPEYVDSFIKRICAVRGMKEADLEQYRGMMNGFVASLSAPGAVENWCASQVYLALGMLLSAAAVLGIDACPIEGFSHAAYNEALDLPARGYSAKVVAALGYRSQDDALASLAKVRFPAEQIFERR